MSTNERKLTKFLPISKVVDVSKLDELEYADISKAGRNFKDLTGKFFGHLFILGPSKRILRYNSPLWMFYAFCCACGENIVEREAKQITRMSTKSCGCIRFLQNSKEKDIVAKNKSFQKYVARAIAPNKSIEIKKEEFFKIFEQDCFYCGAKADTSINENLKKQKIRLNGIDRVDNKIGYKAGNIVPCCFGCNWMKQDFDQKEFIRHLWKIRKHLNL